MAVLVAVVAGAEMAVLVACTITTGRLPEADRPGLGQCNSISKPFCSTRFGQPAIGL